MSTAPRDLAQIRLDNALILFEEFVTATVKHPDAATLRGLEFVAFKVTGVTQRGSLPATQSAHCLGLPCLSLSSSVGCSEVMGDDGG